MIRWNEVTWYSKLGAIILFVGVVPSLCFYIGLRYQQVMVTNDQIQSTAPPVNAHVSGNRSAPSSVSEADNVIRTFCGDIIGGPELALCVADAENAMAIKEKETFKQQLSSVRKMTDQDMDANSRNDLYKALQSSESVWEKYADAECTAEQLTYTGGMGFNASVSFCLIDADQKRIDQLQNRFQQSQK